MPAKTISNHIELIIGHHKVIFDRDDGDIVASIKSPHVVRDGNNFYLQCAILKPKRTTRGVHRIIWEKNFGDCPEFIDHANGNGLDNRKSNLRMATRGQNRANWNKKSSASSKYKGVCKNKSGWQASCASKYIGTFATEIEAAKAYDLRAKQIFGCFASLNFKEL